MSDINDALSNEYKFVYKFPKRVFAIILVIYIFSTIIQLYSIISYFRADEKELYSIILYIFGFLFFLFMIYTGVLINIFNKDYFIINKKGISHNDVFHNKHIEWDSEIYYMITDSFKELFLYKKMIPLNGKMVFEKNIKHGYISIKIKKSLKIQIDNKGWIGIRTKLLTNKVEINDIVKIINNVRGIDE
jgi:hypothetical protein